MKKKVYEEIEQDYLEQCHIIVSTLNSCSKVCLENYFEKVKFRMCIVDEAPTALEPSLLIPFVKYKSIEKIVLLGDVKQLNPIVIANESINYGYNRSLFQRLAKGLYQDTHRLIHQYRQMPNLAEIITNLINPYYTSQLFYKNQLINGIQNMYCRNTIEIIILYFKYNFQIGFNIRQQMTAIGFFSVLLHSQKAIKKLVKKMIQNAKQQQNQLNIFYKIQIFLILRNQLLQQVLIGPKLRIYNKNQNRKYFIRIKNQMIQDNQQIMLNQTLQIHFKEKRTIQLFYHLYSLSVRIKINIIEQTIRSNNKQGFLKDKKRANVALSRARYCQYIFGTKQTMKLDLKNWNKIIKKLEENNEIIKYNQELLNNPNFFSGIGYRENEFIYV